MLENWIKGDVFSIDPANPDPGRVTIRRLNREEYQNTIRDLMGFDYKVQDELPPDDTGYGFDNIGDVLTTSPMLLEKYMQAAETIVNGAVPRVGRVVAERTFNGNSFRNADDKKKGDRHSFYDETRLNQTFKVQTTLHGFGAHSFEALVSRRAYAIGNCDDSDLPVPEFKDMFDQHAPTDVIIALQAVSI